MITPPITLCCHDYPHHYSHHTLLPSHFALITLCSHHTLLPSLLLLLWSLQAAAAGRWAELLSGAPAVFVTGASSLEAVLELLAVRGLHRVYVINAEGKAISIITLTDVLRLITKP